MLLLVAFCGAGIGLVYVLLTPLLAPRLAFVAHQPALAADEVVREPVAELDSALVIGLDDAAKTKKEGAA